MRSRSPVAELVRLGPFRAEAVKTSINLAGRAHFGSVRHAKDGLSVGFRPPLPA